jgi:hypothetical protein
MSPDPHEKRLESLEEAIHGNGKPGLKADVAEIRRDVSIILSVGKWILTTLIVTLLSIMASVSTYLLSRP